MFAEDAKSVADEVRAAELTAKLHREPIQKMLDQYCGGKWFRSDLTSPPIPENHAFAYADWLEPQLAYAAPAALVEANWEKSHGDIAKWMEACQRRNTECYPIVDDFRLWVLDIIFGFGVLKVGMEKIDGKPVPLITHIPVGQFGQATGSGIRKPQDSPLQYHRYEVDLDDLPLMEDVDMEAVERVQNTYDSAGDPDAVGVPGTQTGDRKRFMVFDIWLGKQRKIGTLLSAGGDEPMDVWLRAPRPWVGPKSGPFVVTGLKRVPNSPYFMSPIMAVMQQIEKANAHLRADAVESDSMRTLWVVDESIPDAAKIIEESRATGIAIMPGVGRNLVQKLDLGGVHPNRLEHTERILERIKRFLGMGDAVQGISNSDTATANQIASQAANIRVEYARQIVNASAAIALKAQMWYMFNDPEYEERISFTMMQPQQPPMGAMMAMGAMGQQAGMMQPMPPQAGQMPVDPMNPMGGGMMADPMMPPADPMAQVGMPGGMMEKPVEVEAYYHGGTAGGFYRGEWFPPQVDLDWERDFTVTVDVNSTSHTSNQQKLTDALTLLDVQERGWNMLMTMQGADVENSINRVGEAMNIRNLFKQLYSAQLVAVAQAMNPMGPVQTPEGASPAMGGAQQPGRPMLPAGAMGGMRSGGAANLRPGTQQQPQRAGGAAAGRSNQGGAAGGAGMRTTPQIGAGGGGF